MRVAIAVIGTVGLALFTWGWAQWVQSLSRFYGPYVGTGGSLAFGGGLALYLAARLWIASVPTGTTPKG